MTGPHRNLSIGDAKTRRMRRQGMMLAASVSVLALLAHMPARAAITVQNGDTLNLNGATQNTDTLELIDGSVVNGTLNASSAFNVRNGTISAFLAGLGELTKTTSGVVTLSSANSYTGTSNLFAGTLQLLSSAALGTGRIRTTFGVLDLATGLNVFNEIELRNTGLAINVDAGTATWGGIISQETGVFGFEKTGAGNLRLTGANTFTGPTTVSAGELTIAGTGVFQSDTDLVNGAFLTFVKTEGYTYNGVISGTGRVSATNGPLTLTAAQTLTNSTFTVNPGAGLILQPAATLGDGTNTVELRGGPDAFTPALFDLGGTTQSIQRLDVSNVHNLVENGALIVSDEIAISAGTISANLDGAAGLTKDSSNNTVILSGANSYTGATVINGGILIAQGGSAIGDTSDVTIAPDGTLQIDFSETIGALSGAGAVNLQGNVLTTGRDGVDSIFDGLLAGTGALVKTGSGSLTLTGVNTYEGGTTLEGGTLRVEDSLALGGGQIVTSGASVLDYADGINLANPITLDTNFTQLQVLAGSATQSGVISQDAGDRPLEKTGAGTLTFTAANTYSGLTTVSAGTLRLTGSGRAGNEGSSVTVESGATFDLTDTTQTLTALTLNGNAIVTGEVFGDFPNAFLNVDTVEATTAAGETAALDVAFASSGTITKNGAGTLRIGGFPNFGFTGTVEHNAGTLQLIWQEALGSGTVNMNGDTVLSLNNGTGNGQNFFNRINLAAAGAKIDVATNISVQHGEIFGTEGFEKTGFGLLGIAAPASFTGLTKITEGGVQLREGLPGVYGSLAGPIEIGAAGYFNIVRQDEALNLAGVISGAGGISTDGIYDGVSGTIVAGKWTLSGNNTYSGGTNVSAGTLRAGSATAFGTGFLNTNNSTLNAPDSIATISLNGFDISASALQGNGVFDLTGNVLTVTGSGGFVNGASFTAGNLTVADGANQSFGGIDLSPVLTLTVDGTVGLEGAGNVAPQAIVIGTNGRLDLEFLDQAEYVVNAISGVGEIFLDDSLLTIDTPGIDVTLASLISGTGGSLKKTGAGVLELSGTSTFDGGIEVAEGTLRLASNGAAGLGPITTTGSVIDYAAGVNNPAPIVINSDTTQLQVLNGIAAQSGVISELGGPRPLEKIGTGNLILTAANTYTGLTTVTEGRLQLGPGGGILGNVFVGPSGNAWFDFNQTANYTYSGILSGGQVSITATGAIIEWTGANTHSYTGIGDGTLLLSGAGTLGATTATVGLSGFTSAVLDLGGTTQTISTLNTFHEFGGTTFTNEVTNGTLNVNTFMNIESGTFSANLGGTGSLIKTSAGTATLSGTNTFTGQTTINGGTLVLQGGSAIGDANPVDVTTGATLQVDSSETVGSLSGQGTVSVVAGQTLSANIPFQLLFPVVFEGQFTGTGTLEKLGASQWIITSAQNFAGNTKISEGSIRLSGESSDVMNIGPTEIEAGASLILNGGVYCGDITGSGDVVRSLSVTVRTATLCGQNTFSGQTSIRSGTLIVSGGNAIGDLSDVNLTPDTGFYELTLQLAANETIGSLSGGTNGTFTSPASLIDFQSYRLTVGVNNLSTTIVGGMTGTGGLTKTGTGTLTLANITNYTGATFVEGGILAILNSLALTSANTVNVAAGGIFELGVDLSIASLEGAGTLDLTTKTLTTGHDNTDTTWTGTITGGATGSLQKVGTGIFSVAGDMNQESTTVQAGEINFNGTAAGNIAINAAGRLSGTHTINGNLINLGTLAPGNSPGTTTVLGNYTGGGVLEVEVQFDNAGAPVNGVTHDFLNIAGDVLGSPTTVSLLSFPPSLEPAATTGNGIEIVRVGGAADSDDFTMTSYLFGDYFYDLQFIAATTNSFYLQSTLATPGCAVTTGNDACFIDEAANILGTAIDALAGNDTLQLNGATDFTFDVARIGTTYTNFEVFQKADTNTVTLAGVAGFNTLGFDVQNGTLITGTNQLGSQGAVRLFTPGILRVVSNLQTGSLEGSGTLDVQAGEFQTGNNNASTTFSGSITGAGDFQKTGTGTLTLSGTNTLSGYTSIIGGVLEVDGGAAINDLSRVILDPAGTFRLLSDETIGSLEGTLISGGTVELGSHRLTLGGNNFGTFFSGVLSGTGGLTVIGSSFAGISLGGINTFTGDTIIDGSQVILAGTDGALASNVQLLNGGRFTFQRETDYTYSGVISGNGTVRIASDAATVWTGANSFTGTLQMREGTLALTSSAVLGANTLDVEFFGIEGPAFATLDLGGTSQTIGTLSMFGGLIENGTLSFNTVSLEEGEISANLAGSGTVTKITGGLFTLSGTNTYTGPTNIQEGTLAAQGGAAIGDLSAVTVSSGATFSILGNETVGSVSGAGGVDIGANSLTLGGNNASTTLSGVIAGVAGKLIKQGSGNLTLAGNNTFTGGIDIFDGTLTLGSNQAAGTGPITTFGTVINYLNLVNSAAPIVLSSNDTQLQQTGGTAEQSGPISESGGPRPLEKIGNGNLTLSGVNTFTGPMTISDGTLTLQGGAALADSVAVIVAGPGTLALNTSETVGSLAGAGALTMSAGTALTAGGDNTSTLFSGTMTGGGFTKAGSGNFTFTGTGAFGGPLSVNGGTLTKTGGGLSGASAFNVASGATAFLGATTAGLNGAGVAATAMGAVSVAGGGTLYLDDNSQVTGTSLGLATGSNLGLFLTTNTAVYPQLTMSGAASVAGTLGVYLDPLSFGGTTATSFAYDNVISGASRSGTFSTASLLQTPNSLFSLTTVYGANDVDLLVQRASFGSIGGGSGNTPNVGGAIETIFVNGTSDPDLLNLISTLSFSSPGAITPILSSVSGSTSAETEGAGLRTDDPWKQSVAERVNAARAPGCVVAGDDWCFKRYAQANGSTLSDIQGDPSAFEWLQTGIRDSGTTSAWARAIGIVTETDLSDHAPGSKQWSGGMIVGADHVFSSSLLAGVAGQYIESHVDFDASRNSSVVKALQLGAYVSHGDAQSFINGNVSVIGSQAKSERFMTVGLLTYEVESFLRSWTGSASAEAGTILEADGFRFEPTVALNYQYSATGAYREKGGGGLGLLIDPDDTQSLKSSVTARLSRVFDLGDRKIVPQLRADWRHEFLDRGQSFTAAFAGAPGVLFDVDGTKYARDTLGLGASITVPITGQTTGYVDAQGALSEDTVSSMLTVGVRASW